MDITTDDVSETSICPICSGKFRSSKSGTLLNKRCPSCYMNHLSGRSVKKPTSPATLLSVKKESAALGQHHITRMRNLVEPTTPTNQLQPPKAQPHTVPSSRRPSFWSMCPFCEHKYHFPREHINKKLNCVCRKAFIAVALDLSSPLKQTVPSQNQAIHFSSAASVGEKRKRSEEECNITNTDVLRRYEDGTGEDVHSEKRGLDDNGDVGRQEEPGLTEVYRKFEDRIGEGGHNERRGLDDNGDAGRCTEALRKYEDGIGEGVHNDRRGLDDNGDAGGRQGESGCINNIKFNNFERPREEAAFSVNQAWALYDPADGKPRHYAIIRKVSSPSFGLRITYLEPDPDDEKEIQWFEEELPVSVGKFRLGKNQNTKDRSMFSHHMICQGSLREHLFVFPRKGETWALFKNWDINWSSEPDSHRKYEYELVEILSNYTDADGVSVAFLHKAKGFASVFFRMGTGDEDTFEIRPHSLYRFSHMIPSFQLTKIDRKGLPKNAYELDQAALPENIEEITVPPHLLAEPKPEALCFPRSGKVFQTGQIWAFYSGNDDLPLYYCRIQKITFTQAFEEESVFKLHVSRLKATTPFPEDVIQWTDKKTPVGCGTFLVRKAFEILTTDDVSHQVVEPQTSMDRSEYTILPKIGEVWAIYRSWTCHMDAKEVGSCQYDIVEVLDDSLDYKVLVLEPVLCSNEDEAKKTFFRAAKGRHSDHDSEDGAEAIFTIPKSKMLRFSHQIPASRLFKEIDGRFVVDSRAVPANVRLQNRK